MCIAYVEASKVRIAVTARKQKIQPFVVCELHEWSGVRCWGFRKNGGVMVRGKQSRAEPWAVAAGVGAGAGAVAFAVFRGLRALRERRAPVPDTLDHPAELDALEDAAVALLRRDPTTGACAIDVAAIGPGIIELSGVVPTPQTGQRAARLLHALAGVRTVISRLEVDSAEARLAATRGRQARGDAALQERQWYGVRVGTGRRRQSPETEPARTDDSLHRRTRELEVQLDDSDDGVPGAGGSPDSADRPL
jgi:hypothetical protein